MTANGLPRILVCASQPGTLAELRHLLAGIGCELVGHPLNTSDPDGVSHFQLILVEGGQSAGAALEMCRRLRERLDKVFVPILYLTDDQTPAARLASFESGADTYLLRPFAAGELLAQVKALL